MFSLASPCRSLRDTGNPVAEVPPGLLEWRAEIVVPSHARREFSLESWVILPEMEWASVTPGWENVSMFSGLRGAPSPEGSSAPVPESPTVARGCLPAVEDDPLASLLFLFKSFSAEKENGPVLYLHLIDIRRLALDNLPLLALLPAVSDSDLFTYGKACHKHLAWSALPVAHQSLRRCFFRKPAGDPPRLL